MEIAKQWPELAKPSLDARMSRKFIYSLFEREKGQLFGLFVRVI